MKAATRSKYGSTEVLSMQEIEKPTSKDNEVLIRVYAASVNRIDYHLLTGRPFLTRLFTGLFKPKLSVPVDKQKYFGKDGLYFCSFWIGPECHISLDAQKISKDIGEEGRRAKVTCCNHHTPHCIS
jgi:hypothetical protein